MAGRPAPAGRPPRARPRPGPVPPGARPPAVAARPAGLRLPSPPAPTAGYVPAVAAGGLVFVSGQDPEAGGQLVYRGRVGRELTPRQARVALRLAALNALAAAHA